MEFKKRRVESMSPSHFFCVLNAIVACEKELGNALCFHERLSSSEMVIDVMDTLGLDSRDQFCTTICSYFGVPKEAPKLKQTVTASSCSLQTVAQFIASHVRLSYYLGDILPGVTCKSAHVYATIRSNLVAQGLWSNTTDLDSDLGTFLSGNGCAGKLWTLARLYPSAIPTISLKGKSWHRVQTILIASSIPASIVSAILFAVGQIDLVGFGIATLLVLFSVGVANSVAGLSRIQCVECTTIRDLCNHIAQKAEPGDPPNS